MALARFTPLVPMLTGLWEHVCQDSVFGHIEGETRYPRGVLFVCLRSFGCLLANVRPVLYIGSNDRRKLRQLFVFLASTYLTLSTARLRQRRSGLSRARWRAFAYVQSSRARRSMRHKGVSQSERWAKRAHLNRANRFCWSA
jgi:hypothetical protein